MNKSVILNYMYVVCEEKALSYRTESYTLL